MPFWMLILLTFFVLAMLIFKSNRNWFYGLYQTVAAIALARRPSIFKQLVKEEIKAPDGEKYVVWWSSKSVKVFNETIETNGGLNKKVLPKVSSRIWIILPGGMTTADTFYTWDAIKSGLFEKEPWCIFHNPGIVSKCYKRSPPGLTETTYIEHFIQSLKQEGRQVSLIGFSAGSMLTIAIKSKSEFI